MIIMKLYGRLGNQMFQYAAMRALARRLNTEFKFDLRNFPSGSNTILDFNVQIPVASEEEISALIGTEELRKKNYKAELQEGGGDIFFETYSDNAYLDGYWQNEKYFLSAEQIVRKDFSLKAPFSEKALHWKKLIESCECPVAVSIRRGDYAEDAFVQARFGLLPIEYYQFCVEQIAARCKDITLFIFSDDLDWTRKNISFRQKTFYVDGTVTAAEQLLVLAMCKHQVIANSSFAWWGAWLNPNPNKMVFAPCPWFRCFSDTNKFVPAHWNRIMIDWRQTVNKIEVSVIIVMHNDLARAFKSVTGILNQSVCKYEIILIDDASDESTAQICQKLFAEQQQVRIYRNKHFEGLNRSLNDAINYASGEYILFLQSGDNILPGYLWALYSNAVQFQADVVHTNSYFMAGDAASFQNLKPISETPPFNARNVLLNASTLLHLLTDRNMHWNIYTKFYSKKFLTDKGIRFTEELLELGTSFIVQCALKAEKYLYLQMPFYVRQIEPH